MLVTADRTHHRLALVKEESLRLCGLQAPLSLGSRLYPGNLSAGMFLSAAFIRCLSSQEDPFPREAKPGLTSCQLGHTSGKRDPLS